MGMCALYQTAAFDGRLPDAVEEAFGILQTDGENVYLDKMWDGLHFLLTGRSLCDENAVFQGEDYFLHIALAGDEVWEDAGEYAAVIRADKMPDILNALENVDFAAALEARPFSLFAEHEIYPEIWDDEDEEGEELAEELADLFDHLKKLYRRATEQGLHVIVGIG